MATSLFEQMFYPKNLLIMKTEKNLKLSFNLFLFFGWLTVIVFIAAAALSFTGCSLSNGVVFAICLLPVVAYAMYRVYVNNKKLVDPNYKVDMLPHYKSAFCTMLVTFVISLVLIGTGRPIDSVVLLLGVAVYFAGCLTLIAKSKNNRI